ncbi:MAG: chromosome segregation protein ScpA [Puniceicoccaceae bacterium]|nr:MAG: chromosome segregation protein ScpA [Puniceicoccaceae bacterium]
MVAEIDPRIRLSVFEGPLDLLLFLIRKNELDIYDIPIQSVLDQYLDVLRTMETLNLEVAGDFFVMAATLMEIKSRLLLPRHQQAVDPDAEGEEPLDPRWELVHQLIQYRKFKDAAARLQDLAGAQSLRPPRVPDGAAAVPAADRPLQPVDRIDIWNLFNLVLRRLAEKITVGSIEDDTVTVVDQMEVILHRLRKPGPFLFTELFPGKTTLRTLVVTFLALLELTRLKQVRLYQEAAFADIRCEANDPAELPPNAPPPS